MSYRFNNGNGGVTCDICNVLIDSNISYDHYIDIYGAKNNMCFECRLKNNKDIANIESIKTDIQGKNQINMDNILIDLIKRHGSPEIREDIENSFKKVEKDAVKDLDNSVKDRIIEHVKKEVSDKEWFTCFNCCEVNTCVYAYDLYNTESDCLADK